MENKIKNVWGWLEEINYKKSPLTDFTDEDWDKFNNYMILRFISMDQNYIDIANLAQQHINTQDKQKLYLFLSSILPKQKKWNKYIKSTKKEYPLELLQYVAKFYECSVREAKHYCKILSQESIKSIITKFGVEDKKVTKLMKK